MRGMEEERVALHTLRERCWLLQRRLDHVESENVKLAAQCSRISAPDESNRTAAAFAQLVQEKSQLASHVFLVVCENKRLWGRLNELLESNQKPGLPDSVEYPVPDAARPLINATLARVTVDKENKDLQNSLEEISLKFTDSYQIEKTELFAQYEQMIKMHISEDKIIGVMPHIVKCPSDILVEIKNHIEKLSAIKKVIYDQQNDLKKTISNIKTSRSQDKCNNCRFEKLAVSSKKDIELSPDNSEPELSDSLRKWGPTNSSHEKVPNFGRDDKRFNMDSIWRSTHSQSGKNKNKDNVCPICGVNYQSLTFEKFLAHVQGHFQADEDHDSICDNYEGVYK